MSCPPGEIFVELGLDLKMDSPFGQTMVAELANGSIGYIPCSRAYRQENYEVVSARCAQGPVSVSSKPPWICSTRAMPNAPERGGE